MRLKFGWIAAIGLSLISTEVSAASAGTLRICRPDYADPRLNARQLEIPPGIVFNDWGPLSLKVVTSKEQMWDLHIVTLDAFTLTGKNQCANVNAQITKQSKVPSVTPSDKRDFEPGSMVGRDGADLPAPYTPMWDPISQFTATVVKSFN